MRKPSRSCRGLLRVAQHKAALPFYAASHEGHCLPSKVLGETWPGARSRFCERTPTLAKLQLCSEISGNHLRVQGRQCHTQGSKWAVGQLRSRLLLMVWLLWWAGGWGCWGICDPCHDSGSQSHAKSLPITAITKL